MELLAILRVLRRWWLLIVLLPVVSAVTLWLGLRARPPVYEARVQLQITTPQREDVAVYDEYRYGSLRDEITIARNNFSELLKGNDVRRQVVSQLALNEQESEFPVDVETVGDADFIYVTVEAESPDQAAEIANTLVATAIAYYGDLRARPTYAERDLFAEKLQVAAEDLHAAQAQFAEFQTENGAVSLDEQLATYQNLLEQLQMERDRLLLEETTGPLDPIVEVDRLIEQHQQRLDRMTALAPPYEVLQEDVQIAREKYRRISAEQESGSPVDDVLAAEEIAAALEQLSAAEEALADFKTQEGIISLETEMGTTQTLLEQLRLERDRLLLEETTRNVGAVGQVEQLIAQRQDEMERLSALAPTYELLSDDLAQAREQYSYILNKYTEAELTAAAVQAANFIQIVEPAQAPEEPASNTFLLMALAIVGSVGVGVLLAFLLDYVRAAVDDTIALDETDGSSILGLPVVGKVPQMADGQCQPDSPEAEAVRRLRTRLTISLPDNQMKTLLVTSPQPADGKSVVAANLSVVMSGSGTKVVIVDADLRNPGLHKWFDQPNQTGLADWLRTDDDSLEEYLPQLLRDTDIPNLSLVTAGPSPQDPSFLLSSPRMHALLDVLSERFDRVVVDGPPVVVAPDAVILASLVQSTLLVMRPDRTSRSMAREAIASLSSRDDVHIVGAVLNKTSLESYAYHYHERSKVPLQEVAERLLDVLHLLRKKALDPRWRHPSHPRFVDAAAPEDGTGKTTPHDASI